MKVNKEFMQVLKERCAPSGAGLMLLKTGQSNDLPPRMYFKCERDCRSPVVSAAVL